LSFRPVDSRRGSARGALVVGAQEQQGHERGWPPEALDFFEHGLNRLLDGVEAELLTKPPQIAS